MRMNLISKGIAVFPLVFLLIFSGIASGEENFDFSFTGPNGIIPGREGTFSVLVSPESPLSEGFDIAILVPSSWNMTYWTTNGYPKSSAILDSRSRSYKGAVYNAHHWKFSQDISSEFSLEISVKIPATEPAGISRELSAIWTSPTGFGTKALTVRAGTPTAQGQCGDGSCGALESCSNCPNDCGVCWTPVCGDGACSPGEICQSDCGQGNNQTGPITTTTSRGSGEIFGIPEDEFSGYIAGFGIALAIFILVIFAFLLLKGMASAKGAKVGPSNDLPPGSAPIPAYPEGIAKASSPLKDQISGKVEIKPVQRRPYRADVSSPPPETAEKKIALLKRAMIKVEKVLSDIGKDL